jgi:membrane-associated protease RseP (regulator of RpoE activity)
VSNNPPELFPERSPGGKPLDYFVPHYREPEPSSREWIIPAILLALTILSTTFAGLFYIAGNLDFYHVLSAVIARPGLMVYGLPFSVPLISILLAHELGHFIVCRYYGMHCTPPFFLPIPISIAGTMGAFIKIKSPFRHRRALFDIGVAGPLAGFIFTLPTLWIGISHSKLIPKGALGHGGLSFGEPLIFRLIGMLAIGYSPGRQEMEANPIAMAGWIGLFATSLNLFPIWQLDGGHIAYAMIGRSRHKALSIMAIVFLMLVGFWSWRILWSIPPWLWNWQIFYSIPPYLIIGTLLLIIGVRFRFYHPPPLQDEDKLGPVRLLVGLLALIILISSFMPIPFTFT